MLILSIINVFTVTFDQLNVSLWTVDCIFPSNKLQLACAISTSWSRYRACKVYLFWTVIERRNGIHYAFTLYLFNICLLLLWGEWCVCTRRAPKPADASPGRHRCTRRYSPVPSDPPQPISSQPGRHTCHRRKPRAGDHFRCSQIELFVLIMHHLWSTLCMHTCVL